MTVSCRVIGFSSDHVSCRPNYGARLSSEKIVFFGPIVREIWKLAVLDLKDLLYFVQVVDRGGFSAAGRSLRIPKSTLSHRVQQLEASLGVRLVSRNSRRFGMTDIGRQFYENALATLQQAEITEASVRQHLSEPSGVFGSPPPSRSRSSPCVIFCRLSSRVSKGPDRSICDRCADRHRGRGLRPRASRTLTAVAEFDACSTENCGCSLASVRGIGLSRPRRYTGTASRFSGARRNRDGARKRGDLASSTCPGEGCVIPIEPRFTSNDMVALKQAACTGLGIVALPAYVCWPEVRTGA